MTLIIIFALVCLVFIAVVVYGNYCDSDLLIVSSAVSIVLSIAALLISVIFFIPSKKDSEIIYEQLIEERTTIVEIIESDKQVDRISLNHMVVDYNNRVIEKKKNSQRFIFRDYYSKDVDWEALETISWR